jgi:uncharacterized Fe-S center protein
MSCVLYDNIKDIPVHLEGRVAIKLHMGEEGNPNHISPQDVAVLVENIKENGGDPFLVDTTTLYRKKRYTVQGYEELAKKHGFGRFRVVIARDDEYEEVEGIKVAKAVAEADSLLLLSHVTGHISVAFGGAVKNLAMGCVVKDGKRRIHGPMRPVYDETKCIKCGACVESCPFKFPKLNGKVELNLIDCPACQRCIKACQTGAMHNQPDGMAVSFREFALAAKAVTGLFKTDKIVCINALKKVTKGCDCGSASPVVSRDMGYLAGKDPLSLDVQSARMLKDAGAKLDWETWDKFEVIAKSIMQ